MTLCTICPVQYTTQSTPSFHYVHFLYDLIPAPTFTVYNLSHMMIPKHTHTLTRGQVCHQIQYYAIAIRPTSSYTTHASYYLMHLPFQSTPRHSEQTVSQPSSAIQSFESQIPQWFSPWHNKVWKLVSVSTADTLIWNAENIHPYGFRSPSQQIGRASCRERV